VANEEEPRDPEEESSGPEEELSPDPFVQRLRPDPSEPPIPVRVLEGLLGNSDREGYWRLYFSRELDNYAEFRQEDVVYSEPIPPDQPPFVGLDATRVGIRRDATIEFTRARTPRPIDEFDLDVRLGAPGRMARERPIPPSLVGDICPDCTGRATGCFTEPPDPGCLTALTDCDQNTCQATCTCHTQCGQNTCQATCTCHTQCNQWTCNHPPGTQYTQCNQWTCYHEYTDIGPTCRPPHCTYNPYIFTCGRRECL
jgi:hypothetical protein